MTSYVLDLEDLDRTAGAIAGGKGANLGELARIGGVRVPDGFCVTTAAFREVMREHAAAIAELADPSEIATRAARLRALVEQTTVPEAIVRAIEQRIETHAYAVRSSATAEDLPTASFAGQHESILNVVGAGDVIAAVRRCWASLFSERAVRYRHQHGIDPRRVEMAVVIQRMVPARASGVLFTADPITAHRKETTIAAIAGLGEALVSGLVDGDRYRVRAGAILERHPTTTAIVSDAELLALEQLGRRIEAHFGAPQDIEWCLAGDEISVVQSRPITTLYPIPETDDDAPHVYLSVGHQQMMTDPMRPLGLALWLMTTPAAMRVAGGRLFVDVAPMLASPARARVLETFGQLDPLVAQALAQILARGFVPPAPPSEKPVALGAVFGPPPDLANDPAIAASLIAGTQVSIATLETAIAGKSGAALFDFILADVPAMKAQLFAPESTAAIRTGIGAVTWIDEHAKQWLGEANVADTLSQSAPNNPTSEMGLALLDVADAIRPYPEVVDYLARAEDATFWRGLWPLHGGPEATAALGAFLDRYGARGAGEIDITRTRWSEAPTLLVAALLANVQMFTAGESRRRFEAGRRASLAKEHEILARLSSLPDGEAKADEMREKIRLLRNFIGYREYPKFGQVQRTFVYRRALLREADRLASAGVIRERTDAYFLSFAEFHEVARTGVFDPRVVDERRAAYAEYEKLSPPRVMTSEGEVVTGIVAREAPAGALVGVPVSRGVVEGRARVVTRMEDARLEPGDILVTRFTDPSWTPLFVAVAALVTEVGSVMSHGAVVAREYGLPAVVSVEAATRRIADGQRIRVNGTEGYVELLPAM